ncbi:MAG: hypothetical protein K0S56_794 [Microvirga sp.]|jgi:hypothetical protein|nr:hypothetical protein [Microvirga sp.]
MSREVVEGRGLAEFPVVAGVADYLEGGEVRILSRDDEDGAFTAHVLAKTELVFDYPEGRTLELFVLTGSITAGGKPVSSGIFVYMPPKGGPRSLVLHEGSTIFLATGEKGIGSGEFETVDPDTKPWEVRTSDSEYSSTGTSTNVVKYLRVDPENRNNFGIDVMWPGGGLDCTEWHTVADEIFRLTGDLLLLDPISGKPVEAEPGAYAWRPSMSRHLPKYSHTGCVQIFRNREWPEGKGEMVYVPAPDWPRYLAEYKAKFATIESVPGL